MYALPHLYVPRRLLSNTFIHFYIVGAEWLRRAVLVMEKGALGGNRSNARYPHLSA